MTSQSPYEAPAAALNENIQPPNQGIVINKAPASQGFHWFLDGIKRTFRAPFSWTAIGFVHLLFLLVVLILSLIPIIGAFLPYLFYPVIVAGFMQGARNQDTGNLSIGDLFSGFSIQTGQLFLCGALYIAMMIVAFIVTALLMVLLMVTFFAGFELSATDNVFTIGILVLLGFLLFLAFTLPILMAIWFAPGLIILDRHEAISAITFSFKACMKNFLPYLVYGFVGLLFLAIIGLGYWLLFQSMVPNPGDIDSVPMSFWMAVGLGYIGLAIFGAPIMFNSVYSSYQDIFVRHSTTD